MPKFCDKCGNQLKASAKFCDSCGKATSAATKTVKAAAKSTTKSATKAAPKVSASKVKKAATKKITLVSAEVKTSQGFGMEFVNWWKNIINFTDRTSRRGFWLGFLYSFIATTAVLAFFEQLIMQIPSGQDILKAAVQLALLSAAVRRLRDAGKSWTWLFLCLLPFGVGFFGLVRLLGAGFNLKALQYMTTTGDFSPLMANVGGFATLMALIMLAVPVVLIVLLSQPSKPADGVKVV